MKQFINLTMTKCNNIGFLRRNRSAKGHHSLSLLLILTFVLPAISYSAPPAPPSGLCLSPGSICIGTTTPSPTSSNVDAPTNVDINNFHPGYYMHAGLQSRTIFDSIKDNSNIIGVKKLYIWRDIEKEKGVYDFSEIVKDLEYAQSINKRLWIQIAYTRWNGKLSPFTPSYMWNDSAYGGGDCSGDGSICNGPSPSGGYYGSYERTAQSGGWYPLFWNTNVEARFDALYTALGNRFNGEPYFEGISIGETTVQRGPGWTVDGLENAFKQSALAAKKAFPNKSVMYMINFAAFDLEEFAAWLANNNIGIGSPDIKLQNTSLTTIAYPQYITHHNDIPTGPDVQSSNYDLATAEEILLGAISYTNPWYMFWVKREPYFTDDVLTAIAAHGQLPAAKSFYDSQSQ